ncbi:MAG TPA: DMT family transporter [Gaiellaceae bacterium]|jgi:drug/metabolite transporter (DMT)-like permease|nr:DMT family transporter [Gaiellaceae bacterium]
MVRGYVPLLLIVAGIWGASYLFIKVAVREIEPTAMMDLRLVLAAAVLVPFLAARLGFRHAAAEIRSAGFGAFVLGTLNMALPFTLIAWGEKHIDSGVAAIANATVPIFVAILAIRFNPGERVRGLRLVGVALGLVGTGVLTGVHPQGGWWGVAGTLAVVVASLSYASANLYTQHRFQQTSPLVITTASTLAGALVLLPPALFQLPDAVPGWKPLASVAALGIGGTAFALIFFYAMINRYGASRASLVTYLLPPFALCYGVVFLDERMTLNALLGLFLILAGVALGSGFVQLAQRRRAAAATPRP